MVNVLKEYREPSIAERLGKGFSDTAQAASQQIPQFLQQRQMQEQEGDALERLTGENLRGIPPDLRKVFVEKMLSQQQKQQQESVPFQQALQTLSDMESLLPQGVGTKFGPGVLSGGIVGQSWRNLGKTGEARAQFEQLGKSLIPLVAAGVPVRNKQEFEKYSKIITDPDSSTAQIKGAIAGLRKIFNRKLGIETEDLTEGETPKERRSLNQFWE